MLLSQTLERCSPRAYGTGMRGSQRSIIPTRDVVSMTTIMRVLGTNRPTEGSCELLLLLILITDIAFVQRTFSSTTLALLPWSQRVLLR